MLSSGDIVLVFSQRKKKGTQKKLSREKRCSHLTFPKAPIPRVFESRYRPMVTGVFSFIVLSELEKRESPSFSLSPAKLSAENGVANAENRKGR